MEYKILSDIYSPLDVKKLNADELNALAEKTEYGNDGFSVMPYSYSELNDKLNSAYKIGAQKYEFLQNMSS